MSARDVRAAARGQRSDYRLEATPIGRGGQAQVFRGVHKPTGTTIALKRLTHARDATARARMGREIQIGMSIDHPNVMPILDSDTDASWFVMPLAFDNLEARRQDVLRRDTVEERRGGHL